MTKRTICELFDLPLTTLNEWEKEKSRKHSLYTFLRSLDEKNVRKQLVKVETHRIFHILNRNISKDQQYTHDEIKQAFSKTDYASTTPREQIIYAKFFKECDIDDLESFSALFNVSKRNIKKLYEQIPERSLKGVAKAWDRRFRLKHLSVENHKQTRTIPPALQKVIDRRKNV